MNKNAKKARPLNRLCYNCRFPQELNLIIHSDRVLCFGNGIQNKKKLSFVRNMKSNNLIAYVFIRYAVITMKIVKLCELRSGKRKKIKEKARVYKRKLFKVMLNFISDIFSLFSFSLFTIYRNTTKYLPNGNIKNTKNWEIISKLKIHKMRIDSITRSTINNNNNNN